MSSRVRSWADRVNHAELTKKWTLLIRQAQPRAPRSVRVRPVAEYGDHRRGEIRMTRPAIQSALDRMHKGTSSRRNVLKHSAGAVAAASAAGLVQLAPPAAAADPFAGATLAKLLAAADSLIPAQADCLSASKAGVVSYLNRRGAADTVFTRRITAFLNQPAFHTAATSDIALRELEQALPEAFAEFRDAVYEAYYTNPAVLRSLGYELRTSRVPTGPQHVFDEGVLRRVGSTAPFFRKPE